MKRKKKKIVKRNPIAKAVRKIRPKIVPDTRRKKLERVRKLDEEDMR
jgi:hypothetical protein